MTLYQLLATCTYCTKGGNIISDLIISNCFRWCEQELLKPLSSPSQQTPVHTAAKEGHEYTMKELAKLRAATNIKDNVSETRIITAGRLT